MFSSSREFFADSDAGDNGRTTGRFVRGRAEMVFCRARIRRRRTKEKGVDYLKATKGESDD